MGGIQIVFAICDLVASIVMIALAVFNFIWNFVHGWTSVWAAMGPFFQLAMGLGLMFYVIWRPEFLSKWFPFLDNWFGYGITIIYASASLTSGFWVGAVIAVLTLILGICYVVFYFTKCIDKHGPLKSGGSPISSGGSTTTAQTEYTAATAPQSV
ncbi:hypothetical protein BLNAU_10393 [Blattamonas nauphoetae]|uniref:MARVEL domain-containing protein n=1 Tax=Blattamonas nauphoetae TaxID=2049346 RepID=A0ABQ9XTC8_9EUKA|nr:hypothetical protein BLNAU_10393 [Blattamonas nauphoetae]